MKYLGKELDLLKDGVHLCSAFEFLFPTMGINYRLDGGEKGESYKFLRIPDLPVKKASVLLDEDTPFLEFPPKNDYDYTVRQLVEAGMYKQLVDVAGKEAGKHDVPNKEKILLADNPLAMVANVDCFEKYMLGEDAYFETINSDFTPWFGGGINDMYVRRVNGNVKPYDYGYIKNAIPFNFLAGCGYRTLFVNILMQKMMFRSKFNSALRLETSSILGSRGNFFTDERLKRVASGLNNLTGHWKYSSISEQAKNQYCYISSFDPSNEESILNLANVEPSKLEFIQSNKNDSLSGLIISKKFHPYADVVTKAVYDTYKSFECTHSMTKAFYYSPAQCLKIVVGTGYTNIRMYTYQMINDQIRFPLEQRFMSSGAGENKGEMLSHSVMEDENEDFCDKILNAFPTANALYVCESIKNQKEMEASNATLGYDGYDGGYRESRISTRSIPGINDNLREGIGKYLRSPVYIDEIQRDFNAYEPSDVEEINRILAAYAKTPGFVILKTDNLFKYESDDEKDDSVYKTSTLVAGIFNQDEARDSTSIGEDSAASPMPEYVALPFFYFQYLLSENLLNNINIICIVNFIKGLKISGSGACMQMKGGGLNIMPDLTNFSLTPFVSLYERMYSVMYHDRLYKFINARAESLKANVTMFVNHAAKEFVLFTDKDSFANNGDSLFVNLSFISDKNYGERLEMAPYFLVAIKPVDCTHLDKKEASKEPYVFLSDNAIDDDLSIKLGEADAVVRNSAGSRTSDSAANALARLYTIEDAAIDTWASYIQKSVKMNYQDERDKFRKENAKAQNG